MQAPSALLAPRNDRASFRIEVLDEIRAQLAPYQVAGHAITGATVICDGTTVDSLTIMDMIVELEDRFDIAIPMKQVTEIRTVDQLADTILRLAMR